MRGRPSLGSWRAGLGGNDTLKNVSGDGDNIITIDDFILA